MSYPSTRRCACCGKRIRIDDDVCSPQCDAEMERRAEEELERMLEARRLMELPEAHEEPSA